MRGGATVATLVDTAPRTLIDNNLREDQMRGVAARHKEVERRASSRVGHMSSAATHLAIRLPFRHWLMLTCRLPGHGYHMSSPPGVTGPECSVHANDYSSAPTYPMRSSAPGSDGPARADIVVATGKPPKNAPAQI